jgi:hypothetical protein
MHDDDVVFPSPSECAIFLCRTLIRKIRLRNFFHSAIPDVDTRGFKLRYVDLAHQLYLVGHHLSGLIHM